MCYNKIWWKSILSYNKKIWWKSILSYTRTWLNSILSSPRAKRASPKGERASRARAVTVSQCPHSEVGQDFLLRRRVTLTETAVTWKRKVEKWIRRCLREGYKRAIDEIRDPIAKNGLSGKNAKILGKKNVTLFNSNHVPATTGQCCPKEKSTVLPNN